MPSVPTGSIIVTLRPDKTEILTDGVAMFFYKNLYVSSRIKDPNRIKKDLVRGKGHLLLYVLTLSPGSPEKGRPVLEIMHCANLQQPYYRSHPPFIVGLASGKEDAIEMVRSITQEAFDRSGQWDAAAWLLSKVKEEKPARPFPHAAVNFFKRHSGQGG